LHQIRSNHFVELKDFGFALESCQLQDSSNGFSQKQSAGEEMNHQTEIFEVAG
jgi:hypothetical protein